MTNNYLAADLGSSGGKVFLGTLTKEGKLTMREAGRFATPRVFFRGHLSINVYEIYDKIFQILEQLGREGIVLSGFGVDSWASDFGIVNPQGELLGLPVFYRDKRTEGMQE